VNANLLLTLRTFYF